jgi:lantibiotic biosynthesis protein
MSLRPAGFFLLRTPLLPFDRFLQAAMLDSSALPSLAADPIVARALSHASPSLARAIERRPDDPKTTRALLRYLGRMASRSTPFGLLAGISIGRVGGRSALQLPSSRDYEAHARLDAAYVARLARRLLEGAEVRRRVLWRQNPTIFVKGRTVRFTRPRHEGDSTTYEELSATYDGPLRLVLEALRDGRNADWASIEATLRAGLPGHNAGDIAAYVQGLAAEQIVLPTMGAVRTGDYADAFVHDVRTALGEQDAVTRAVARAHRRLKGSATVEEIGPRLDEAHGALESSGAASTGEITAAVDLWKPGRDVTLSAPVLREIARAAGVAIQLSRALLHPMLDRFATAFRARYEDASVPLLEAVDRSVGIGDALSLPADPDVVQGLPFHRRSTEAPVGPREVRLAAKLAASRGDEIVLDEADVAAMTGDRPVPDSCAALVSLLASAPEAVDRGDYRILVRVVTSDATSLLARFSSSSAPLAEELTRLLREVEPVTAVRRYVEIVHAPDHPPTLNTVARPSLRRAELAIFGVSDARADSCVALSDLVVSVTPAGRIELRSRRGPEEIVPRMSNAHFFWTKGSLPVYELLGHLAYQDVQRGYHFGWGSLFDAAEALPRVSHRRVVLAPARFRLSRAHLDEPLDALRVRLRMPRLCGISGGDSALPLDLDSELSRRELRACLARLPEGAQLGLEELLVDDGDLVVVGPEGRFRHELVVPLVRDSASLAARETERRRARSAVAPSAHVVGGSWLFAKIYLSEGSADRVLGGPLRRVARALEQAGHVTRWFFVRYADPDVHVRVRFQGPPRALLARALPALRRALGPHLRDGRVHDLRIETYVPETGRYGGRAALPLCEEVFFRDSEAVAEVLAARLDVPRWQVAALGIARLLDDLGVALATRCELLRACMASLGLQASAGLGHELARRYAVQRDLVEALVLGRAPASLRTAARAYEERSRRIAAAVRGLRRLERRGELRESMASVVGSLLHMHANRTLCAASREHEYLVYDWLARAYRSLFARAASGVTPPPRLRERAHGRDTGAASR